MAEGYAERDDPAHTLSHRRKIGAFYTPLAVSMALSTWGIRKISDTVLEPCFGGCTFLEAAIARLTSLGNQRPLPNLYGCDLDPVAFQHLAKKLGREVSGKRFLHGDFMSTRAENFGEATHNKFDLILGNPPYIRYNKLSLSQRSALNEWKAENNLGLDGRASLWAYFVLHALNFIKEGGRLALVLPGSFLHAQYAVNVRRILRERFRRVSAIAIAERIFVSEGTDETTVVLLAEGFSEQPEARHLSFAFVDTIREFANLVSRIDDAQKGFSKLGSHGNTMVPDEAISAYLEVCDSSDVISIGSIAKVDIGLVTGNSKFFIRSKTAWDEEGIGNKHLAYILPRSQWVNGIELTSSDVATQIDERVPCLALNCPANPKSHELLAYLSSYDKEAVKTNVTFRKRPCWYRFLDKNIPDAFFVFMSSLSPRLILNSAKSNCTNSVYRVYFKDSMPEGLKKLAAISMHTTFSQLSAEIVGYARGAGALKLEPSKVAGLRIALPQNISDEKIEAAFYEIDSAIRLKSWDDARRMADALLFPGPDSTHAIATLEAGLAKARGRRLRKHNEDTDVERR